MNKYIDSEKLIAKIKSRIQFMQTCIKSEYRLSGKAEEEIIFEYKHLQNIITSLQQEQPHFQTIKGWIARDDAGRLGLYDQKPTRKTEPGAFSGIVHSWVIGDTWIGRFSLDQTAKTLFPNLCWTDDPMEVELMFKPVQEQPEVNLYNNGWIDCRKQMPKETKQWSDTLQGHREWTESDLVLAWDSMYGCRVDATKNGKWMSEQRGGYTGQVVHGIIAWRPIPEFNEELLF